MARDASGSSAALPLDDPRWLPLANVHGALCPSTGHPELAARDLTGGMAKPDGVRSMRRRFARLPDKVDPDDYPERERLRWAFWNEHELYWSGSERRLMIVPRPRGGQIVTADAARGYAFFAWRPDLERLWPTMFPPSHEPAPPPAPVLAPDEAPQPLRRGPQIARVYSALRKEFPPFGKTPKSLSIKQCAKKLSHHWEAENKEFDLTDPSEDVVAAGMKGLGRSDD